MWKALLAALLLAAPLPLPAAVAGLHGAHGPTDVMVRVLDAGGMGIAPPHAVAASHSLRQELLAWDALHGKLPAGDGLAHLDAQLALVPADVQAPAARILRAMTMASVLRDRAFSGVDARDVAWARGASLNLDLLDAAQSARLAGIEARIDRPLMMQAGTLVLATVQAEVPLLRQAAERGAVQGLDVVDPFGSVEIAGTQDDVHTGDRALLIDLGGDDVWANNAGADFPDPVIDGLPGCATQGALQCTPLDPGRNGQVVEDLLGRRCSVDALDPVFDVNDASTQDVAALLADPAQAAQVAVAAVGQAQHAAQDIRLQTDCLPQGGDDLLPWVQDFLEDGTLSDGDQHFVAVGIDLAGDDTFAPPRVFNFMNDGSSPPHCDSRAMGEAGKLWSRNLTAGSSFAGIGVLWDASGSDFYGGRSLTQGSAHLGAFAALVDEGPGSDHYVGIRFAQGSGLVGAAGLLYDDGGGNVFELKNDIAYFNEFEAFVGCDVSVRDGQGRDNFDSVGALVVGGAGNTFYVEDHIALGMFLSGASREDPTTTQGSTGFRLNVGPSIGNVLQAAGRGVLWVQDGGSDAFTRPGRGNRCLDVGGTFWDEDAAQPLASIGPCPA